MGDENKAAIYVEEKDDWPQMDYLHSCGNIFTLGRRVPGLPLKGQVP